MALLQLQGASGLTPVTFGNSSQVRLGTPVLALGNAEGHGGAKPAPGIINALDRSIQASDEGSNSTENLKHMLQTNAKIEQGDSGGALANNAGQVIGMITAANTGYPRHVLLVRQRRLARLRHPDQQRAGHRQADRVGPAERHRTHRPARFPRRGGRAER